MNISRICITALIFLVFFPGTGGTAFLNFSASDESIVKGDEVIFTFTYEQGDDKRSPEKLEINLDYDGNRETDYTLEKTSPGKTETLSKTVEFDKPGYFDTEAEFILTYADGDVITEDLNLGTSRNPRRINVANWKFDAGGRLGCVESTPAVSPSGLNIYFGSDDHLIYAVSVEDGSRKWSRNLGGDVASTPAVDAEGYVYAGSGDGHVYCLEPIAGAIEWRFPAGAAGRGHFFSSPALDEERNRLYIGSTDHHLYALDMDTGERIWRFQTGSKIVSSPAIGFDHTVYIGSLDGFLYAVNPDGTLKWRFDAKTEIRGSPALDRDGTIFFGSSLFQGEANPDNGLYAISTVGQKKWFVQKHNGFAGSPVIADSGTLVVSSWDNRIYGSSRSGGLEMYKTFDDDVISAPALGSRGYLFAGAKDGKFYALELDSGNQLHGRDEYWDYKTHRPVAGSSPVAHNGYVYVATCEIDGEEGSGALYSFLFDNRAADTDRGPAEDSPWPLFRNNLRNTGMTDFRPGTVAPEVAETDPAPGVREFNTDRWSITAKFSMPMEPSSIYQPPDPDNNFDGFFGFTVEPFDADPEAFEIDWNADHTVFTLTLPDGVSFEREKQYTATIEASAYAEQPHAEDGSERHLLYDYKWRFRHDPEDSHDNSHNRFTCFISSIWETSPLGFMADLW
ncbi:MAG: PQQ-binding-like beta-propeller repeat protein [Desulfobacteraceae bacterium]|nr:PQQ-binding-like beta-propeller repeat protein [Desulfobacteraceae bacterium]